MAKIRPYPRRAFSKLLREWLRSNTRLIFVMVLLSVILIGIVSVTILVLPIDNALKWWLLGVTQIGVVASVLHLGFMSFLAVERKAIWQLRGAWGEELTQGALRKARRKKLIWGSVDSIDLQLGDIDHLVLPRRGGFVVIDSKWHTGVVNPKEMATSAARAKLRAEALAETQLKPTRACHRARVKAFKVVALVVIWGPSRSQVPAGYNFNGVHFVAGPNLLSWLAELTGEELDRAAALDALDKMQSFRDGMALSRG